MKIFLDAADQQLLLPELVSLLDESNCDFYDGNGLPISPSKTDVQDVLSLKFMIIVKLSGRHLFFLRKTIIWIRTQQPTYQKRVRRM